MAAAEQLSIPVEPVVIESVTILARKVPEGYRVAMNKAASHLVRGRAVERVSVGSPDTDNDLGEKNEAIPAAVDIPGQLILLIEDTVVNLRPGVENSFELAKT